MTGFLRVACPSCGAASSKVPAAMAGRLVRCPKCGTRFEVPRPAAAAAAPAVAPADPPPAPTRLEEEPPAATRLDDDDAGPTRLDEDGPAPTRLDPEPLATALDAPEPRAAAPTLLERPTPAAAWKTGDVVLDLYEVQGVLGEGGMGRVYRVRHRGWGLDLAVKAPLPAVLEAAGGADLFEREAETWVNLGLHPHVVTCHYVRRVAGLPLVFAELVDGGSLHEAIHRGRLDSAEAILDVAIQFAWGLHHAHQQGLVHRDVKPANVMLTADGVAKVTDFGLARARPVRLGRRGADAGHTMTVEGGGGGTPAYASPEQMRGEAMSRRSDLWSFALCVLEMFAGRRTWNLGLAAPEVMRSVREEGLDARGRPAIPPDVADLVERSFAESPESRPHDMAEAASVLRSAWERIAGRAYPRQEPRGGTGAADALNNRAVSLVDLGRATEAAALWRRALAAEPHHPEATYNGVLAAWTAASLADPEAVRRMEEACASHAGSARAQQLKARVHLALGQEAEAESALARATALGGTETLAADVAAAARPAAAPRRAMRGLPGPVAALALVPDGSAVIAGSGGEVRVWDTVSGQLQRTLAVEGAPVRALLALPGGRSLVVAAEGAPLALWDLGSGKAARPFERTVGFATCLALAPDGPLVVAGGSDRTVRMFDPGSGRCVREIPAHDDAVTAVAAGPSLLASASRDGSVRLWSREDGRRLGSIAAPARTLALLVDEAQSRLVAAGEDGVVRDWGLHSRELVRAFASHAQPVLALALSPDGERLLSGSADRTLRAFEAEGQRLLAKAHLDLAVQAVAVARDGAIWAAHGAAVSLVRPDPVEPPPPALCRPSTASEEEARAGLFEQHLDEARRSLADGDVASAFRLARTARTVQGHERAPTVLAFWDDLSRRLPRSALGSAWEEGVVVQGHEAVLGLALDAAGRRGFAAVFDGTVCVLDTEKRAVLGTLTGHDGAATSVALGREKLVSGGRDWTVRVWEAGSGRALAALEGHAETVTSVDASPDGARAASGSVDGTVRLWDLKALSAGAVLEGHAATVSCVRFSADGLVLASAGWDGATRLWDAETGAALGALEGQTANIASLAVHPAGRQVATGDEQGLVRVFDPRTRREVRRFDGRGAAATGLSFTADGRFLLVSGRDASVRVFDLRRGDEARALPHPAPVLALALSASGTRLLTAGADGAVRAWRLDWELDPGGAAATATTVLSPYALRARAAAAQSPIKAFGAI